MRTLQGIIAKSTLNSLNQYEKLGYFSENIANSNTTSYKAVRFEDIMSEYGTMGGVERKRFTQGQLRRTENPLDVAVEGSGFIPITTKTGDVLYTRDGSFTTDKNGTLMTISGDVVGSGIKIPANYKRLEIKENGDIYSYYERTSEPKYLGTIPVVVFKNPEGLKEIGNNCYRSTENSGEAELTVDNQKIVQYHVESSNVDLFSQVNDIMRLNTSLVATTTLMSRIDDMYEQAINIRD